MGLYYFFPSARRHSEIIKKMARTVKELDEARLGNLIMKTIPCVVAMSV